jgi:hypothetical protein
MLTAKDRITLAKRRVASQPTVVATEEQIARLNVALPATLRWVEAHTSRELQRQFDVKAVHKVCTLDDDMAGLTRKCDALDWLFGLVWNQEHVFDEADPVADGLALLAEFGVLRRKMSTAPTSRADRRNLARLSQWNR